MACFEAISLGAGAIAPVSFALERGEALVISGSSGVGKTRCLRALADLDLHTGVVQLDGISQNEIPAHAWRRQVALVPAESAWWHDTTALHFEQWPVAGLKQLQLAPELGKSPVSRLSSGERARLSILRAWQSEPPVLLIDEPGANLDRANQRRLESLLSEWRHDRGLILVCASHDPDLHRRLEAKQLTVRKA